MGKSRRDPSIVTTGADDHIDLAYYRSVAERERARVVAAALAGVSHAMGRLMARKRWERV